MSLKRLQGESALVNAIEQASGRVLEAGYRNVVVDLMNEVGISDGLVTRDNVHTYIAHAQGITDGGRRLLVGSSSVRMEDGYR